MRLKGEWELRRQRQGGEYRVECLEVRQSKAYLRNYKDCRPAEARVGVGEQGEEAARVSRSQQQASCRASQGTYTTPSQGSRELF